MIYVTVGTQKFPFNRLLRQLDLDVEQGKISEPVFAQIGNSTYIPRHYESVPFLTEEEYMERVRNCSLLITHGGTAAIMQGLKYQKPVIVVPRLAKYGEHVDDHQLQITRSLSEKNYILPCGERDELADLIRQARTQPFARYVSQRQEAVAAVRAYLNTLKEKNRQ